MEEDCIKGSEIGIDLGDCLIAGACKLGGNLKLCDELDILLLWMG